MKVDPVISVIIPAHNAQDTLSETLQSVLAQSYSAFEVIVVDDGSDDGTGQLADRFAAEDERIRLITIANGGVAHARNVGIEASRGEYIAPLDADDLWHPRKLELQHRSLVNAGTATGVVYNWFQTIDGAGGITGHAPMPRVEGQVLHRHLDWNFISNGSTPLIRKSVLADLRYDPSLHLAGNQGCEDYLLQLQLALRTRFALIPAFLTGYRRLPGSMSTNSARMIRSHIQVFEGLLPVVPANARAIIKRRLACFHVEYARNRAHRADFWAAAVAGAAGLRRAPISAMVHAANEIRRAVRPKPAHAAVCRSLFRHEQDPFRPDGREISGSRLLRLAELEKLDGL